MKTIKNLVIAFLVFGAVAGYAQQKQNEKLQKSAAVLKAFAGMKENIPGPLMQKAQGIVVIPSLVKAGLGIGGQRGKGIALVKKADGSWSNPVFVTLTGGSVGFQAGVQAIDLVMVFTKGTTLTNIGTGGFTLGGDVGVAAGPVGRSSSATTNTKFDSEIYSYSRSKGLFAGLALNGSKLSVDADANKAFYTSNSSASSIFNNSKSTNQGVVSVKSSIKAFY